MCKIIKVLRSSQVSHSEVVKSAVNQLLNLGEKVHIFEVIKQRADSHCPEKKFCENRLTEEYSEIIFVINS